MVLDQLQQTNAAGVELQPWLYSFLIHALCDFEEFDAILEILQSYDRPEVFVSPILWMQMLDCASRALHHPLTALIVNRRVRTFYTNPPVGVCTNILDTAARHGDAQLATTVFEIMTRRSGNAVKRYHYEALVDTYARADDLKSAISILTIMIEAQYDLTPTSTRSLFKILCQKPNQVTLASECFKQLLNEGRSIPIQAVNIILEVHDFHNAHESVIMFDYTMTKADPNYSPNEVTETFLDRAWNAINAHSPQVAAPPIS